MKKLLIFFLSLINLTGLHGQLNEPSLATPENIRIAALQGSCDLKIIKEKLTYANKAESLNLNELETSFKKLYKECSLIINSPGLVELNEETWVNNMIQEILTLKQDDETRNCFNQTIIHLKGFKEIQCPKRKTIILEDFYKNMQSCSDQFSQKIALSHLDAAILRWEYDPKIENCNNKYRTIMLKNIPEEQENLAREFQHVYETCFPSQKITFEQSMKNIRNMINTLKSHPQGPYCLETLLNFQTAYQKAQTENEKKNSKKLLL